MSTLTNWFKFLVVRQAFKRTQTVSCLCSSYVRTYAKTPSDDTSKQIMVQGNENEEKVRVRRARPGDVPRVLRFVREHARAAWPGLAPPPPAPHRALADYVARALAQGHSMVAEQQEGRRGWSHIRGLALAVAVCPWDATLLEKWARCIPCTRSRRLLSFTAHCLRAPALHDKYRVHNILQVVLVIPQDKDPKSLEIIKMLTKNVIKRGKESGFPLIRFDVSCESTEKHMDELQMKKEWQLSYDILSDPITDTEPLNKTAAPDESSTSKTTDENAAFKHRIVVYTALTRGASHI